MVQVRVCRKVLDRWKDHSFIRENWRLFREEVRKIVMSERTGRQPLAGKFIVTPDGTSTKGFRVAWHVRPIGDQNVFFIDDFLYHEAEDRYIENWREKAYNKEITPEDYERIGFISPEEAAKFLSIKKEDSQFSEQDRRQEAA